MANHGAPIASDDADVLSEAELVRLFRALSPRQRQRLVADWQAG